MEKGIVVVGFGIMALCFMLSILIGVAFVWGGFVGLAIMLFGWYFWEE